MISDSWITKSEILDLNLFLLFSPNFHTHSHTFPAIPKTLFRRKYLNMMKELKMGLKAAQNYLLGRIRLNYSYLATRLSHHWFQQWGQKINFITKQHFQAQPSQLFHIRAKFSRVLYDRFPYVMASKFHLANETLPIWRNVSKMKHNDTLHIIQCQI
jgi:hypothetical protein